jgi:hypothetical protein
VRAYVTSARALHTRTRGLNLYTTGRLSRDVDINVSSPASDERVRQLHRLRLLFSYRRTTRSVWSTRARRFFDRIACVFDFLPWCVRYRCGILHCIVLNRRSTFSRGFDCFSLSLLLSRTVDLNKITCSSYFIKPSSRKTDPRNPML